MAGGGSSSEGVGPSPLQRIKHDGRRTKLDGGGSSPAAGGGGGGGGGGFILDLIRYFLSLRSRLLLSLRRSPLSPPSNSLDDGGRSTAEQRQAALSGGAMAGGGSSSEGVGPSPLQRIKHDGRRTKLDGGGSSPAAVDRGRLAED
uniref:Uncharacterized protein n=1 Tax=Oryza brachyantha TaxID=4533 RepID=J3LMW2_ORYBR